MSGTVKKLYLSEGVSVTAPTDLSFAALGAYANDAAWVTANGTAYEGAMYVNTTLEVVRYYANAAWRSVLGASDPTDSTKVLAIDLTGNTTAKTATLDFNCTDDRTFTYPDASTTLLGHDTAQVVTNKDIDGGTASNTSRLTVPKAGTATLTGLTRKAGTVVFDTDLSKPYYDNGSSLVAFGSGSGSGEKNYITNPSAADAITGWTAVSHMTVARTTTASELPREYTTASGIKITATASQTQSTSTYVYYDFTLDDVDLSKKLKIQWSQKQTGSYVASDLAVVITTQADRATALHTPTTTNIPAVDGVFETYFDSSTTATLSLVIRATTNMADNAGLVISDVVVGPGVNVQGAVVENPVSFTPSTTQGFGTITSNELTYRRVGDKMHIAGRFITGTVSGSEIRLGLPSGFTIGTLTTITAVGTYSQGVGTGTTFKAGTVLATTGNTYLNFSVMDYTPSTNPLTPQTGSAILNSSTAFTLNGEVIIPIAEWAGSGTVNLGQNNVEYAWSTDTTTTAGHVGTTGFGYGPGGVQFNSIASTTNDSETRYLVRFQTPIQETDSVELEVYSDGEWLPGGKSPILSDRVIQTSGATVKNYGMYLRAASAATDMYVCFGNSGRLSSGSGYAADGSTWAGIAGSANSKWRLKKASSGQAVGFGAATATSLGLVSGGTVPGSTSGAAIATGYLGEALEATASVSIGTTETDLVSLTLTTGVWLVSGTQFSSGNTGVTGSWAYLYVKNSNSATNAKDVIGAYDDGASGVRMQTTNTFAPRAVVIASGDSDKTVKIRAKTVTGTSNMNGYISAVRIA